MSYLVLMQREWRDDPKYLDVEGAIYHYPEKYKGVIQGYERFVYYRPSRGSSPSQSSRYIGYGELGSIFLDSKSSDHYYVNIRKYRPFPIPVSYLDDAARMYETGYASRSAFQGKSIRPIDPTTFFRIVSAGGIIGDPFRLDDVDAVLAMPYSGLLVENAPTQPLREILEIPPGTGYRPSGKPYADVFEAAALQERARGDHQRTLSAITSMVRDRGGTTFFNNNIDLFATLGEERLLIEAKSLPTRDVAVDRMRYGIGQLTDYGIRYRAELGRAEPVLAFGRPPDRETSWISTILEETGIAFVALQGESVRPLNEKARRLALFS